MVESSENAPAERPWQRTRTRVPENDGAILAIPSLPEVPPVVAANATLLKESSIEIAGRTLALLRVDTRKEALATAAEFTERLTGQAPDITHADRVLVSGHQPELFHPGVWVKNFAVSRLACRTDSTGLNLIVDSDTLATCRVRVPGGSRPRAVFDHLDFDAPREVQPWEEARVLDQDLLSSFADRAATALATVADSDLAFTPIVSQVWPQAARHGASTGSLSETLSVARILLEREFGYGNLELPVSQLCGLETFSWFAADMLLRAEKFREIHNQTLTEYRRVNRIRSHTHPVPVLGEAHGWIEAPFRVWSAGEAQRKAVFVRTVNGRRQISSSAAETGILLDVESQAGCESVAEELRRLAQTGIRFRTRALTTTMFTRLCLTDLFVHGIGGAKYDEMTDRILSRFYGLQPPGFLTLSATAWLPFARPFDETPADAARLRTMLRELQHNPQRHIPAERAEAAAALVQEKQLLIEQQHAADQRKLAGEKPGHRGGENRYRRFPLINRELAEMTAPLQNSIRQELAEVEGRLAANAVLKCREFSLCLYPAGRIEKMLAELTRELDADKA